MKICHVSESDSYIKLLVYAHFGVGKTLLAGTAADHPDMRDVLFICVEDGTLTIRNRDITKTSRVASVTEMRQLFWNLANRKKGYETYKTIVVDSVTELQSLCLQEVVEKNCAANPKKDPDRPTIRDHGDVNFILTNLFRAFRDLPMHVIFTALVRELRTPNSSGETDPSMPPSVCGPELPPKLANKCMAYMDFVWPMVAKEDGTRLLYTQPKRPWVTKTRGEAFAAALPPIIKNPSLPQIYDLLTQVNSKGEKQQ